MIKKLIIALTIATSTLAYAEFKDGNKLLEQMQSQEESQNLIALGYVTGVADMGSGVTNCPRPNSITAGQVYDMVNQYLIQNPSARHYTADVIVTYVLAKAWPCAKTQRGTHL